MNRAKEPKQYEYASQEKTTTFQGRAQTTPKQAEVRMKQATKQSQAKVRSKSTGRRFGSIQGQ